MLKEDLVIKPSNKLTKKYIIVFFLLIIGGVALFNIPLIVFHFLFSSGIGLSVWLIFLLVLWGITVLVLVLVLIFSNLYTKSIEYRISSTMITVHKGVINRKMKNVPIEKITNVDAFQGPFDRMLKIGTILIHTAGYSGTAVPEAKLDGLEDYKEILTQIMKLMEK